MSKKVLVSNTRSVHYRHIHPDGISVTNSPSDPNEVHLYLYGERYLIPDQIIFEEKEGEMVSAEPVDQNPQIKLTREYEAVITLNIREAKDVIKKLQGMISTIENER